MESDVAADFIQIQNEGVLLQCWIQPRASKSAIVGIHDHRLKIALAAPPVDGEANAELRKFLAKKLHVSSSRILLVSGEASRRKTVRISGISPVDLKQQLGIAPLELHS